MIAERVAQILKSVQRLRPMPITITRVLKALDDPMSTAGVISDFIGLDQALSAMVLQMANSAAFGYTLNCTSLSEAVMRLGFVRVRTLVLGAAAARSLNSRLPGYRMGAGDLWNHSIGTAMSAHWLSQALRYPNPEEAYVAGLLHDIGKLLLDHYVQIDYARLVNWMRQHRLKLWQVEEEIIGIDHGTVGSFMAEKWNLPVVLVDAVHFHHAPSLARTRQELPAIVNIANAIIWRSIPGQMEMGDTDIHPEALRILGIRQERLERLQDDLARYLTHI